jgi:hypothetical protein
MKPIIFCVRKLRVREPEVTQSMEEQGKNAGLLTSKHFISWLLYFNQKALNIYKDWS